ncbi:MAG: hypothetical protein KDG52_03970 [Rhodocyclaceae bacterium]|nr:hypothetical protein [Rhodocyclaceae bacterium]
MIRSIVACSLVGWLLVAGPTAIAGGLDLHWLWDDRCAECHGHAGDFARRLERVDGELKVRHPIGDMREFLRHHYPVGHEVDALYRMLKAQAVTPPRFQAECQPCHGSAAAFARRRLALRGDEVVLAAGGRPLATALRDHGVIDTDDVPFFRAVLERVAREVHRQ